MSKTTNKLNFKAAIHAAAAGGAYNFAIEGAAKKVDFINDNYLVTKSLLGGVIGSGIVYMGKTEEQRAAGYGILGVAGASGAAKLSMVLVTSDEQPAPMQGTNRLIHLANKGGKSLRTMPAGSGRYREIAQRFIKPGQPTQVHQIPTPAPGRTMDVSLWNDDSGDWF